MVADPTHGSKSGPLESDACSDLPKQAQICPGLIPIDTIANICCFGRGVRGPGDINEQPFLHNERKKNK